MKIRTPILAGLAMLLGATTAQCAPPSAITTSLVADVTATAEYLRITDDAALSNSVSPRVQAFATRDHAFQIATLEAIGTWARALQRAEAAEAAALTIDHLGPVIHLFNGAFRADVPGARLTEADAVALNRLRALRASDFDGVFLATHESALRHLLDLYTDYIRNGDDQELRALSVHQKPKVQALLAAIRRG